MLTRQDALAALLANKDAIDSLPQHLREAALKAVRTLGTVHLEDLKITTKDARLINLIPNDPQKYLLNAWEETYHGFKWRHANWHALAGARETILKARQEGISTLIEAICYAITTTTPYWTSVIVADTKERAELLFKMIRRFYDNDPRQLRCRRNTVRTLEFSDLDSSIWVATAGDPAVGRAATIHFLHMSELAFWGTNWSNRGPLLDAVPKDGIVIEETTANGTNEFYAHYMASKDGETPFHTRFIPWYALPDYSTNAEGDPTEEEAEVMQRYGVSHGQARWYVFKRREKRTAQTPVEREFPSTVEEAFIASAVNNVFPQDVLDSMLQKAPRPLETILKGEQGYAGYAHIFRYPHKRRLYVAGVDVACGLDQTGDHDFTTVDIFDADDWYHVCSYYTRADIANAARDIARLAELYNDALLIVERNNYGHAMIFELQRLGCNLYKHRPEGSPLDTLATGQDGFPCTARTKAERDTALRNALEAIRENPGELTICAERAIREMMAYVELPGGKRGGLGTAHDDHVASVGMAVWYLERFLPRLHRPTPDWEEEPFDPFRKRSKDRFNGYHPVWGKAKWRG